MFPGERTVPTKRPRAPNHLILERQMPRNVPVSEPGVALINKAISESTSSEAGPPRSTNRSHEKAAAIARSPRTT